jgi:hypothetical protein
VDKTFIVNLRLMPSHLEIRNAFPDSRSELWQTFDPSLIRELANGIGQQTAAPPNESGFGFLGFSESAGWIASSYSRTLVLVNILSSRETQFRRRQPLQ